MATIKKWRTLGIALALAPVCAGCALNQDDMLHFLRESRHHTSAMEYRVGIGDHISIHAPRVPEIDGVNHGIRPDGKINLKLLKEVKVIDMTAKEIAAKLEVLLSRYYVDPKVSVTVGGFSKKYYVYGQAQGAGPRPYTGRDTLMDAVLSSVPDFRSWTSRVKVIRPSRGDTPVRTIQINVDKMVKEGDWSKNILLEPDDIVYIPPTPGAWLGLRLREILYPTGPAIAAYAAPTRFMNLDSIYENAENRPYPYSYYNNWDYGYGY